MLQLDLIYRLEMFEMKNKDHQIFMEQEITTHLIVIIAPKDMHQIQNSMTPKDKEAVSKEIINLDSSINLEIFRAVKIITNRKDKMAGKKEEEPEIGMSKITKLLVLREFWETREIRKRKSPQHKCCGFHEGLNKINSLNKYG